MPAAVASRTGVIVLIVIVVVGRAYNHNGDFACSGTFIANHRGREGVEPSKRVAPAATGRPISNPRFPNHTRQVRPSG